MFLLRGTAGDDRTRICTATATQALKHLDRMSRDGLVPVVTDYSGRLLSLAELKHRTRPDYPGPERPQTTGPAAAGDHATSTL